MSELDQINHLREEFRRDRVVTLRFWVCFLLWGIVYIAPDFKSIFNSMNVELPCGTRVVLFMSDVMLDWWFFVLPAVWIGWRLVEDRVLKRMTLATLGNTARLGVLLAILMGLAMFSPMLKLINNVG